MTIPHPSLVHANIMDDLLEVLRNYIGGNKVISFLYFFVTLLFTTAHK